MKNPDLFKKNCLELFILFISLSLLVLTGLGEAVKSYSKFKREAIFALAEPVKITIESMLYGGLPLRDLSGFQELTEPVLNTCPAISHIEITDNQKEIYYSTFRSSGKSEFAFQPLKTQDNESLYKVFSNNLLYRMEIPLKDHFEVCGFVRIYLKKWEILKTIIKHFTWSGAGILLILCIYSIVIHKSKSLHIHIIRRYAIAWSVAFLIILYSLANIYYTSLMEKSEILSQAMVKRIEILSDLNIDIDDVSQFDEVFTQYMRHNPEIERISLKKSGKSLFSIERRSDSTPKIHKKTIQKGDISVSLGIFKNKIYQELWKGIKAFLMLLPASVIISLLFFNILNLKYNLSSSDEKSYLLELVKPVFFFGVFTEALGASFLPNYFNELAPNGYEAQLSSVLFMTFFMAYSLIFVPAGKLCLYKGTKYTILLALFLNLLSFIGLTLIQNFPLLLLIRSLTGLAQGMLFISVQNYILNLNIKHKKASSLAVLIIQYFTARISGTAFGSLIYSYSEVRGVFLVSSLLSLLTFISALFFVNKQFSLPESVEFKNYPSKHTLISNIKQILSDQSFLKTAFVGINSKIIMIGMITFALPLLLDYLDFFQEDIGQIMMMYYLGVFVSTLYSSKLADKALQLNKLISLGNYGSALGLILFGLITFKSFSSTFQGISLYCSVIILGISNGLVSSIATVEILKSKTAICLGNSEALSMYRLSERIGNISGPLILGVILSFQKDPIMISYLGAIILFISFFLSILKRKPALILLMFVLFSPLLKANESGNWISFSPDLRKKWKITTHTTITITPKVKPTMRSTDKILVLIAKESSAYSTALESALNIFEKQQYFPNLLIVNYQENSNLAQYYLTKAQKENYQLIFAMGSVSTDYLITHFKNKKIPVLSICAKDPVLMGYVKDYESGSGKNFAFTSLNIPASYQIFYLNKLIFNLRNICVIYEKNNTSAWQTQAKPIKDYATENLLNYREITVNKPELARQELKNKCRQEVIELKKSDPDLKHSIFIITGSTSVFNNIDVVNEVSEYIPVFGLSPSMVSEGKNSATLAIGVSFELNAQLSAIYALKILRENCDPGKMKTGVLSPPEIAISFQQARLKQLKIPFSIVEAAGIIIDKNGKLVKNQGKLISK